jgi:phage gpG-like protein
MNRNYPHPYRELVQRYRRMLDTLPLKVSVLAVNHFKGNFRRQGYYTAGGLKKWVPRKTISKRSVGRGILIKSGRLKRSLRPAPRPRIARVVTDVPYAQVHNEGFEGSVMVSSHERRARPVRKKGKARAGVQRGSYKVSGHSRKMKMPARPFMQSDPVLARRIRGLIMRELRTIYSR